MFTACLLFSSSFSCFSSLISFSKSSMRSCKGSICSEAPALSSSMIYGQREDGHVSVCCLEHGLTLTTRHRRPTTTREPTSSTIPPRHTSIKKLATMTVASRQWNHDAKKLDALARFRAQKKLSDRFDVLQSKCPNASKQFKLYSSIQWQRCS